MAKGKRSRMCHSCGNDENVHFGLCKRCRERTDPRTAAVRQERVPRPPTLEPAHSRPWVHRGGG